MLFVLNDHLQIKCGDCFEPKFLSIILTIPFWLNLIKHFEGQNSFLFMLVYLAAPTTDDIENEISMWILLKKVNNQFSGFSELTSSLW